MFYRSRREGGPARQRAVAWDVLSTLELTPADLDALLADGHVEHLEETTGPGRRRRTFHEAAGKPPAGASRFLLTERGAAYCRKQLGLSEADLEALLREAAAPAEERPSWGAREGTLRWRGEVVKVVRGGAENQRCVLDALQEKGWPRHLANPLPQRSRRNTKKCLLETLKSLSRHQEGRVHLRFHGDRAGGLWWEVVDMSKHG